MRPTEKIAVMKEHDHVFVLWKNLNLCLMKYCLVCVLLSFLTKGRSTELLCSHYFNKFSSLLLQGQGDGLTAYSQCHLKYDFKGKVAVVTS